MPSFLRFLSISLLLYFLLLPSPLRLRSDLSQAAPSLPVKEICRLRPHDIETETQCEARLRGTPENPKVRNGDSNKKLNDALSEEKKADVLLAQLKKSNKEIQRRLDRQYSWFQIKYYLIGTLLIGFIAKTFLSQEMKNEEGGGQFTNQFLQAAESPATVITLSFSLIISIIIDAQILRNNQVVLQQGIWIAHYVEKAFFPDLEIASWEEFIRIPGAYHDKVIGSILSGSSIYVITLVLYVIYIFIFRKTIDKSNKKTKTVNQSTSLSLPKEELLFTFWLLQGVILFSSITIHIVPDSYRVTPFPFLTSWFDIYGNSLITIPIYSAVWGLFSFLSLKITRIDSVGS